jgi:chemotaxis protein MotB
MAVEEDDVAGVPEWVVTFGDMMSLLLTFFIMLVSMSEIKKDEQFQAMLESMRRQFGSYDTAIPSAVPGTTSNNSAMQTITSLGSARRRNTEEGGSNADSISGEEPQVQTVRPGKNLTLGGVIYFQEDSAELSDEGKLALARIVPQIAGKPQKVEVRGHTSRKPTPADSGFRDHWDLAYTRCYNVMRLLVEQGVEAERIRLGSAAANEPIDNGLTAEHRRRNARVEVLMWDEHVGGD